MNYAVEHTLGKWVIAGGPARHAPEQGNDSRQGAVLTYKM
jgi:hypothetical protein